MRLIDKPSWRRPATYRQKSLRRCATPAPGAKSSTGWSERTSARSTGMRGGWWWSTKTPRTWCRRPSSGHTTGSAPSGAGAKRWGAWLYRIATNTALTLLRRRKKGLFASLDEVSRTLAGRVAEECGEDADRMQVRFQQAVLELPLKQRLVFNLRYYDGMSYGQIARVLGQREQTLKVNYHYAVQKLKEKLTQEI